MDVLAVFENTRHRPLHCITLHNIAPRSWDASALLHYALAGSRWLVDLSHSRSGIDALCMLGGSPGAAKALEPLHWLNLDTGLSQE